MGADELRSSFRSQFTASTTPGTALTERSSVLTKDSSVTSLYGNPDEPSVEDVMNMYVKGFGDDEEDSGSNYGDESDANFESRPATAVSEPDLGPATRVPEVSLPEVPELTAMPPVPATMPTPSSPLTPDVPTTSIASPSTTSPKTAMAALVPAAAAPTASSLLAPPTRSTLDAEIRQSKLIFTNPDFISSVPAISNADMDTPERRESSKSLDSEPSISSDPQTSPEAKQATSPPSSISASPSPATSPTPMPPDAKIEPEDPGSRDRYGFKKASQAITRDQYDAWNQEYSIYLARRRRKWTTYLKDSALMTDRPIRFPSPCTKTKRFVRKGIPPDWRGAAWFYYAGGPAILAKHSGLYEKLLGKQAKQIDVEAVERDLHRTFPDNIQFKPSAGAGSQTSERASQSTTTTENSIPGPPPTAGEPPIISSLRRVLHAFSIYNPRIGYCQSLNFLAGLLLLFVETEEQCFWLLNVITIIYLPGTHDMSLEGSKVDLGVLMTELRDTMPAVWDKIGGDLEGPPPNSRPSTSKSVRRPMAPILRRREQQPRLSTERLPPITLCMTAWFMSCFIGTLPIETTLRVWDVFFYEGSKTLFRTALAILKSGESEIKAVKDPMETFGVVQALPRRMLDANVLMEACFKRRNGFSHLSQDVIDERREERRQRAKQDRQETLKRGTTDPGQAEETGTVSRRGTLFGKKKREPSMPRATEV